MPINRTSDTAAILLSARMYPRLLSGYTVDEALFEARQAMHSANGLEQRDWGVPVLYLRDTTGVLFPIPERNSENKLSNGPFLEVADKFGQVEGNVVDVALGEVTGGGFRSTTPSTLSRRMPISQA